MIVIASKPGELGNRLFVFANFIASAAEHNFAVVNPAFDEYATYFPVTSQDLFCRYPPRRSLIKATPSLRRALYQLSYYAGRAVAKSGIKSKRLRTITLDWEDDFDISSSEFVSSTRHHQLVFMQGWMFRSGTLLSKHAGVIRKLFSPLEEHRVNVANLMERARIDTDVLVGVHIRHGYIHFESHRQFWYPPEKYAEMMRRVESLFPGKRVTFLICSDTKQDSAVFARYRVVFGNDHLVEDMYSFAECDYIFGPPSTYTMWASFYGKVPLQIVADANRELKLEDFVIFGADGELDKFDIHVPTGSERASQGEII